MAVNSLMFSHRPSFGEQLAIRFTAHAAGESGDCQNHIGDRSRWSPVSFREFEMKIGGQKIPDKTLVLVASEAALIALGFCSRPPCDCWMPMHYGSKYGLRVRCPATR